MAVHVEPGVFGDFLEEGIRSVFRALPHRARESFAPYSLRAEVLPERML
jgi:hypothetical protein